MRAKKVARCKERCHLASLVSQTSSCVTSWLVLCRISTSYAAGLGNTGLFLDQNFWGIGISLNSFAPFPISNKHLTINNDLDEDVNKSHLLRLPAPPTLPASPQLHICGPYIGYIHNHQAQAVSQSCSKEATWHCLNPDTATSNCIHQKKWGCCCEVCASQAFSCKNSSFEYCFSIWVSGPKKKAHSQVNHIQDIISLSYSPQNGLQVPELSHSEQEICQWFHQCPL